MLLESFLFECVMDKMLTCFLRKTYSSYKSNQEQSKENIHFRFLYDFFLNCFMHFITFLFHDSTTSFLSPPHIQPPLYLYLLPSDLIAQFLINDIQFCCNNKRCTHACLLYDFKYYFFNKQKHHTFQSMEWRYP